VRYEEVGEAELLLEVFQQVDDLRLKWRRPGRNRLVTDNEVPAPPLSPARCRCAVSDTAELVRAAAGIVGVEPNDAHYLLYALAARLAAGEVVNGQRLANDGADAQCAG